jgi:hypothetical protein
MYRAVISRRRSLALMLMASIPLWGNAARAQNAAETPFVDWITGLSSSQYTVTQGTATNFSCTLTGIFVTYLGSCFGNNSATPYTLVNAPPPPSPATYGLPSYITSHFGNPTSSPVGYDFYQLANNEAIVTIITLPPQAAYYSFQSYMFERQDLSNYGGTAPSGTSCTPNSAYTTDSITHSLSADCKYQEFGFFGNAINNADVLSQTEGVLTGGGGLEFNSDPSSPTEAIAIITTPNEQVYTDLYNSFNPATGLSTKLLFLDPMPAGSPGMGENPILNVGTGTSNDIFASIIRFTQPLNGTDGNTWSTNPTGNVYVYRVLDNNAPSDGTDLYTSSSLLTQTENTNEVSGVSTPPSCPTIGSNPSTQSYLCDIKELGTYLWEYIGSPTNYSIGVTAPLAAFPGSAGANGITCISEGTNCAGGTQDTAAYNNYNIGELAYG